MNKFLLLFPAGLTTVILVMATLIRLAHSGSLPLLSEAVYLWSAFWVFFQVIFTICYFAEKL